MRATIESTPEIVVLGGTEPQPVPCRVWTGTTAAGVPFFALVAVLAVEKGADTSEFDRELVAVTPPPAAP